jgi:hypothetical protein
MAKKNLIVALLWFALDAYSLAGISVAIATSQQGNESNEIPTLFTLTRTGDTADQLSVNLLLRGTALPDLDYVPPTESTGSHSITFEIGEDTALLTVPSLPDEIIDPGETLLAILQPGTGYSITPGQGRAMAVIGAENASSSVADAGYAVGKSYGQWENYNAFAALRDDGSVITWGSGSDGGERSSQAGSLSSEVTTIFATGHAFAALKENGSVITWGNGGDSSAASGQLASGIVAFSDPLSGNRLSFPPPDEDSDNDGLPGSAETHTGIFLSVNNTGTDPLNPDTDGDGWTDGDEVQLGSSPLNAQSSPPFSITATATR